MARRIMRADSVPYCERHGRFHDASHTGTVACATGARGCKRRTVSYTVHEAPVGRTKAAVALGRKRVWQGDGEPIDPEAPRTTAGAFTARSQRSAEVQYLRSVAGRQLNLAQSGHALTRLEVARRSGA